MMTLLKTPQSLACRNDGGDVALDDTQVARLEGADIYHHVDFPRAVVNDPACLVLLHVCRRCAERKPDDRADTGGAAAKQPRAERDPGCVDAHRREAEFTRFPAELFDFLAGRVGLQQRVIDQRCYVRGHLLAGVQAQPGRAGVDDAAHAIGTAVVQDRVTFARTRPSACESRRHFLGNDSLQVRPLHSVIPSPAKAGHYGRSTTYGPAKAGTTDALRAREFWRASVCIAARSSPCQATR